MPDPSPHSRLLTPEDAERWRERVRHGTAPNGVRAMVDEIERLYEQHEALQAKYDALWQEREHPFDKSEYDRLYEQFDALLRATVSVRDSWLLYEAGVDEAHLTHSCSNLDQLLGGSPEWVALVERLVLNPAKRPT